MYPQTSVIVPPVYIRNKGAKRPRIEMVASPSGIGEQSTGPATRGGGAKVAGHATEAHPATIKSAGGTQKSG